MAQIGTVATAKLKYRTNGNFWWPPETFPTYRTKICACIWDVLVLGVCFTVLLILVYFLPIQNLNFILCIM